MTDPLVLQHGLNIKADQALALKLDTTGVEDAYLDLHVGDGSIGRYGSFYVGANGTNAALNATLYATGTSAPSLTATLETQYNATGGTGDKSKVIVRAGVGTNCTDAGVHSKVYLESVNRSQGSASGNSFVYINATNNSTDNAVSDSAVFISTPGYVDISAYGFDESYLLLNAGAGNDRRVNGRIGWDGASNVTTLLPAQLRGSLDGSAVTELSSTNSSDGLTVDTQGAFVNLKAHVDSDVVLANVRSQIYLHSLNESTASAPPAPGRSIVHLLAENSSTSWDSYQYADSTYVKLESYGHIRLEAIKPFGYMTFQGGNGANGEYAQTKVDFGLIQNGLGGTGPALFKVLAATNEIRIPAVGEHPTAIQLDAQYSGYLQAATTKNYTVASYARLSSTVQNGSPVAEQSVTELYSSNAQSVSGGISLTKVSAYGTNNPYTQNTMLWLLSDGTIQADSQYYTKVDGVYFVPGGSDTTTDPRRYAFQELMDLLWGSLGAATVYLGPGYHNIYRDPPTTTGAPVQLGGVTVIGSSGWYSGGGISTIYFENTNAESFIAMNYGSTIDSCVFESIAPLVNHEQLIKMDGQENIVRNCRFNSVEAGAVSGSGTGDGCCIFMTGAIRSRVENCKSVGDQSRHFVTIYASYDCKITDCSIGYEDAGFVDAPASVIRVYSDNTYANQSRDIEISGNYISIGKSTAITTLQCIEIDEYVKRFSILNNTVDINQTTSTGLSSYFLRFYGTTASRASNGRHLISGNRIDAPQNGTNSNTGLIVLNHQPNVIISDNFVRATMWGYTSRDKSIISVSGSCDNLKVCNNTFDAEDCVAFYAGGSDPHYGYQFIGNTFKGCRGSISGGVLLSRVGTIQFGGGGCSGMIVSGNTLDFNNDDSSNTAINCAIVQTSGALFTDCTISNNIFRKSNPGGAINHYALNLDDYTSCALNGNVTITGTNLFIGTSASSAYGDDGSGTPNGNTNI